MTIPTALRLPHLLTLLAMACALLSSGCRCAASESGESRESAASDALALHWQDPGMHLKILNRGARYLDAIVTRDTFNHLFPHTVWYAEGDVVGMYNRGTKMTFLVVSEHTFAAWNDEISILAERLCHEKAHRAVDLYQGDSWSELRDASAPGLELDTHHFGHEQEDTSQPHAGMDVSTLAHAPAAVAMVSANERH